MERRSAFRSSPALRGDRPWWRNEPLEEMHEKVWPTSVISCDVRAVVVSSRSKWRQDKPSSVPAASVTSSLPEGRDTW